MKKILILVIVITILVFILLIVKNINEAADKLGDLTKDQYTLSNFQLSELEQLKQIGSINYQDVVKIKKVKKGVFYDDEIIASYACNVNIGIDFADAKEGWAQKRADSAFLNLPAVKILNTDDKVILRSSFPIRSGNWSNEELKQLGDSASTIFITQAKDKFPEAQEELETKLRGLLSLKYKYVEVHFDAY